MNCEKELSKIEILFGQHTEQDWIWVIDVVKPLLAEYPNRVNLWIRCLYIFHNILVEEGCTGYTEKQVLKYFQKLFKASRVKFFNNPKYLFFIGKIMFIAEWYWGLSDDELALRFQEKACEIDSENKLYRWGVLLSKGKEEANCLALKILSDKSITKREFHGLDFAGEYVLSHLRQSSIRCKV